MKMNWNLIIPQNPEKLPLNRKYVILSDQHRDKYGSKAGDFWKNRDLYAESLKFYYHNGFTLIENGDGEELWQFNLKEIIKSNEEIYQVLSKFYIKNRLHLIYGNHNIDMKFRIFHRYWSNKYFPGLRFKPLVFIGDNILVTHGHQWDLVYKLGFIPVRLIVALWKYMELIGFSSFDPSIPADNPDHGKRIDRRIAKWGAKRRYIMICGHTHHAKFKSDGEWYFNSGCGTGERRVTGLEIIRRQIFLVEWLSKKDGGVRKKIIYQTDLPKKPVFEED